jgi:hypothetical protein
MTGALTLWIDCMNKIDRDALSGYQASDLGETGDNLVHNGSCTYPGPGLRGYTRRLVMITSD